MYNYICVCMSIYIWPVSAVSFKPANKTCNGKECTPLLCQLKQGGKKKKKKNKKPVNTSTRRETGFLWKEN